MSEAVSSILVERSELTMLERALAILQEGGDVRGPFLNDATGLLVRAGLSIASDRFVYKEALRRFSPAQWDSLCQMTHAATFACRLKDTIGAEAQDHVDSWLRDTLPVLQRLVRDDA